MKIIAYIYYYKLLKIKIMFNKMMKNFENYLDDLNTSDIYEKCVEISKKYNLRPPLVTSKGTKDLFGRKSKRTTLNFKKELDGSWNSGVLIWVVEDEELGKYRLSKNGCFDFRDESYKTEANMKYVTELSQKILDELNV